MSPYLLVLVIQAMALKNYRGLGHLKARLMVLMIRIARHFRMERKN